MLAAVGGQVLNIQSDRSSGLIHGFPAAETPTGGDPDGPVVPRGFACRDKESRRLALDVRDRENATAGESQFVSGKG